MAEVLDQEAADRVFLATVVVSPLMAGAVGYVVAQRRRSRSAAFTWGLAVTGWLGIALGILLGLGVDRLHSYYMFTAFLVGGFLQICIRPVVGACVGLLAALRVAYRNRATGPPQEANP